MNGILPLWKPKGMTSHDCVVQIRKIFQTKKVGHTGTLDPEVEGVLPICIGQATKIVPFLTDTKKTYIAELTLGIATETEDAYGKIIEKKEVTIEPTKQQIDKVLQSFQGTIIQIPPMYSAVKVNGKKLYEYARKNQTVERPKRNVTIYYIKQLHSVNQSIKFVVECSKGTYIRTLCVDIGKKLGYPAYMSHLVRTKSGAFSEQDSVTFDMLNMACKQNKQSNLLLPIPKGLTHLDVLFVDHNIKQRILYGQKLPKPKEQLTTNPFMIMHENELLAIYQIDPKNDEQIRAVRVFHG